MHLKYIKVQFFYKFNLVKDIRRSDHKRNSSKKLSRFLAEIYLHEIYIENYFDYIFKRTHIHKLHICVLY